MIKNPFSSTGKNTKIASCNENIISQILEKIIGKGNTIEFIWELTKFERAFEIIKNS